MLNTNDITALIRDTESHERALFSIASKEEYGPSAKDRRSTVFNVEKDGRRVTQMPAPRKNTAVASILGGDLAERIRREQGDDRAREGTVQKDHLNVNLLLKGAEKLCAALYISPNKLQDDPANTCSPMPGAAERIADLRSRYSNVVDSIAQYEELISEQAVQMRGRNRPPLFADEDEEVDLPRASTSRIGGTQHPTVDDLRHEEAGIRELEQKKRTLEQRVIGMDKDLGGLLR